MTRRDFRLIEDLLREIREPLHDERCWMLVVLAFANILSRTFPRFDRDKFVQRITKE
jgi:hypothetical protein